MIEEARGRKRIKEGLERTGVGLLAVVTTPVLASQWGFLPSRGTEAHSVLLLKASLAPCGRVGEGSVVPFGLHTALRPEGGGYGREDGDEDVEDFTPGGVVVESSQSVSWLFLRVRH